MSLGQWVACGVTSLVIAASLTVYAGYRDTLSIETEAINTDAWGDRPEQVAGIHNILLLGGDNESEGKRPDVLVVVNINVDNGTVTMVNLPRDLIVDIPRCDPVGDFPGWSGGPQQINHAATYGGLDCLGNTVETTTDIHLDHMVMVDFAGFENIVDTIGGVELCIPEELDDPKAHLSLDPGTQTLKGEQALALARSRYSTEHKNDMGRIKSQQRLIGAILRKVTSGETLSKPTTIYDFLGSVTDSMVTDDGFTVDKMAELAIAMREVDLSRINMVMVPVVDSQTHEYKVDPQQPAADDLFAAIAAGDVLPEDESGDEGEGGESEEPAVEPGDVSVRVLNGTVQVGLAETVRGLLENQGFTVSEIGNPGPRNPEQSTIYHAPGQEAAAQTLAGALDTVRTEEVPEFGEELELVMAADWDGLAGDGSAQTDGSGEGALDGLDTASAAEDTADCA
ncbi:LCP family protein [Nocardiopsis terrae]